MIYLLGCLLATAAGEAWAPALLPHVLWLGALSLALLPLAWLAPGSWPRRLAPLLLLPALAGGAAWWADRQEPRPQANDLYYHAPLARAVVQGIVADDPRPGPRGVTFTLRARLLLAPQVAVVRGDLQVAAAADAAGLAPGMAVRVRGRLRLPPAGAPGEFSYRAYLERRGVHALLQAPPGAAVTRLPDLDESNRLAWVGRWRSRLLAALVTGLDPPRAALFGSLVLGDRASPLPDDVRDPFRAVGLAAVLAASGMQVSLLLGTGLWLGGRTRLPPAATALAAVPALLAYALLTGCPPSVQRATLVGLLVLAGHAGGRAVQPLAALLLAGLAILAVHPPAVHDLGLLLSLVATAGVLHAGPALAARLSWLPPWLAQPLAMTLGAQLWVLPVQLHCFQTFSPLFLPANLGAALLVDFLTCSGAVTAALGLVWPPLAAACNLVNGALLALLLGWARLLASWPAAQWHVAALPWAAAACCYPALAAWGESLRRQGPAAVPWRCAALVCLNAALLLTRPPAALLPGVTAGASGGAAAVVVDVPGGPRLLLGGLPRGAHAGSGGRELIVVPMPPYGRSCAGLAAALPVGALRQAWDVGGLKESPAYGGWWQSVWAQDLPAGRLWPGDRLPLGEDATLQVLTAPGAGSDALLVALALGSRRLLWAEGVGRDWAPPPGLDLAAGWLITNARRVPEALVAAVRPGMVACAGPCQVEGAWSGRVVHLGQEGPVVLGLGL